MTARSIPRSIFAALLGATLAWLTPVALAQAPAIAPAATGPLYAVEFKVGPRWVAGKPPPEQDQFREHSANLRKLREQGSLVIGARYGDKGFILLAAESEAAARALIDADPAVQHGTFVYELNEFSVFYGGAVQPRPRPPR